MQLQTQVEHEIHNFLTKRFLIGSSETLLGDVPLLGNVIDSQGAIELVAFIQQRFNIEVEDDEVTIDNLASVRSIVALIEQKLRDRGHF